MGWGLRVVASEVDLAAVVADELEQLRAAHPDRRIELTTSPDTRGRWDGPRLQQVLRNLVVNALRYGAPERPIIVKLSGEESEVVVRVENEGQKIPPSTLANIFDPLRRGTDAPPRGGQPGPRTVHLPRSRAGARWLGCRGIQRPAYHFHGPVAAEPLTKVPHQRERRYVSS